MPQTTSQTIESFHLLFVEVLTVRGRDDFVLKGGANLRYFYNSLRYSNDIDFDFVGRDGESLMRTVDKVLEGKPLALLMRRAGIELVSASKPKQTETTRRWKVSIKRSDIDERSAIPTKIEFSSRPGRSADVAVTRIPENIIAPYGHLAPTIRHYGESAALEQKMWALADRSETKARDVFDLELLFKRRVSAGISFQPLSPEYATKAAAMVTEVSYNSFLSEVVPFLDPDIAEILSGEDVWGQMRGYVLESLYEVSENGEGSDDDVV